MILSCDLLLTRPSPCSNVEALEVGEGN